MNKRKKNTVMRQRRVGRGNDTKKEEGDDTTIIVTAIATILQ